MASRLWESGKEIWLESDQNITLQTKLKTTYNFCEESYKDTLIDTVQLSVASYEISLGGHQQMNG
jgi:hypothetical protein